MHHDDGRDGPTYSGRAVVAALRTANYRNEGRTRRHDWAVAESWKVSPPGLTTRMARILADPAFWAEVHAEWDVADAVRRVREEERWHAMSAAESKAFWAGRSTPTVPSATENPVQRPTDGVSEAHLIQMRRALRPWITS